MRQPLAAIAFLLTIIALLLAISACGTDDSRIPGEDNGAETTDRSAPQGPGILDPSGQRETDSDLPIDAPEFAAATLAGETFDLGEHRGEVILVNFWATWCAPCVVEIPDLIKIQDDFGGRGLTVLGISVDEDDDAAVRAFVSDMGIRYPIVIDPELGDAFGGVYGLPTTFVIDRKGKIVHRVVGLLPTEEIRPEIERLLQEAV